MVVQRGNAACLHFFFLVSCKDTLGSVLLIVQKLFIAFFNDYYKYNLTLLSIADKIALS